MTTEQMEAMLGLQETYRKMHEVEAEPLEEGLSHAYILQSLADKDINAHVKDNKIIVDKTDATAARSHLKKIGHDHLKVTSKGSGQVAEEVLDELSKKTLGSYINTATKDVGFAGFIRGSSDDDKTKSDVGKVETRRKKGISAAVKRLTKEEVVDEVLDTSKGINSYLNKSAEKRKGLVATNTLDNDNQRKINKSFAGSHKAIDKISHKLKEEELDEGRIQVNHAHDAVGEVLGLKAAVKFATNLKAGTSKHTSWKDINSTLVKQGEQPHHIAKIAAKLKPAQYESVDLDESVNHTTFIKKYKENEDDNKHSENVVHLAKHFGSDEDKKEARSILTTHNKVGNLTPEVKKRREALHKKLWSPVIDRAYSKKSVDESVEELDEKELTPTDVKQKEHIVKGMKKKLQSFKDRYGEKAKGVMYATATNIAKKMPDVKEEFELEEARKAESMQVHHPSYSSAVQHARAQVEKKGYEISDEDWFHHVNGGPTKPSEGKTNSLHIPLQKGGKSSKKVAHIQVYNRGNDIPNNHELNMYVN